MVKSIKKRSASHIYYGIDKDTGETRHISEVLSGAKCNCKCAICGEPFEARKGTEREHHFAHVSNYKCMYAGEVAVYLGLANVLKETKKICIPAITIRFPTWGENEIIHASRYVSIEGVFYECQNLAYPPMLRISVGKNLLRIILDFDNYYEKSDKDELIAEAEKEDYSVLMYKMPNINKGDFSPKGLTELISSDKQAYWVFSKLKQQWKDNFYNISKTPKKYKGGYFCPISISGNNFAQYRDCIYCEYNLSQDSCCRCSAHAGVRHKEDFNKSGEERKAIIEKIRLNNENKIQRRKSTYISDRSKRVPKLYSKLVAPILKKESPIQKAPSQQELERAYQDVISNFNYNALEKTVDKYGRRWLKCKICGEIKQDNQMASYGGSDGLNLGICSVCSRNGRVK